MRYFPFDQPGTFFKGNIHSHSTSSDGLVSPAEVASAYRERNYDFIAITDHFLDRYQSTLTDTSNLRTDNFTTIPGAELHAKALDNGVLWDLIALGLPPDFAPIGNTEAAAALAARASATGAFVAIAHPAWNGVTHCDALSIIDSIDAIEIHNEGHTLDSDRGNGWMLADSLATAGYRISTFAADDAHFKTDRFDRFGGWVHVKAASLEPDLLLESLKNGHYYSSTGPLIHNVCFTGGEIVVECDHAAGIMLGGRGTIRSYVRGDDLTRAAFPLHLFRSAFFRVTVETADGKKAWTNPIWLDE